jgi:hypothetical protein
MSFSVQEKESAVYRATLVDENKAAVPASNLSTLTLTLYDKLTGQVINSRDAQDVKNTNDVAIDETGTLVWSMRPADNVIVTDTNAVEPHVALFRATWDGGAKAVNKEVTIIVTNLTKLT